MMTMVIGLLPYTNAAVSVSCSSLVGVRVRGGGGGVRAMVVQGKEGGGSGCS